MKSTLKHIIPVLSSSNIKRDIVWYEKHTDFKYSFGDEMYAGLTRDNFELHLQFHHGTINDPINTSVIKIFVEDIQPYAKEFIKKGTISEEKLRLNTPWKTHEFGFYDLNKNAIFIVQDIKV